MQMQLIGDLAIAEKECTRILDDLICGVEILDKAPIASSDAEGDLRNCARMHRVFVMVYRAQFHVQRALETLRTDIAPIAATPGNH